MERLVILDYCTGNVDIYQSEFGQEPCMDDLLEKLGYHADDCNYMFFQGDVTFHGEVLK